MVTSSGRRTYATTAPRQSARSDHSSSSDEGSPATREWPCSKEAMDVARTFLRDCAAAKLPTLILPDKDADGLCSGLILYCTLLALGLPPSLLSVHFVAKGSNVHSAEERAQIALFDARYVVLADQGSRPGPAIVNHPEAKTLIVDHHLSNEFPNGAFVLSSAHHEPVATSSTLAYLLCRSLIPPTAPGNIMEKLEYLCVMGTMGDLGTSFRWEPPFPDMRACTKKWTKKVLGDAVSLLNAPRRCARYNVRAAWDALWDAPSPRALVSPSSPHAQRLYDARAEVRAEVERCTHTAPVFSGDGRVALVRISSGAQVHPLIATRWASTLKSARLEMVMCANSGYLPGVGVTNFACRVARCTLSRAKTKTRVQSADVGEDGINIIEMLKGYAARVPGLQEAMGEDFARGHKQASGGIVRTEQFERLWAAMLAAEPEVTEERPRKKRRAAEAPVQKNTLEGWIKKP